MRTTRTDLIPAEEVRVRLGNISSATLHRWTRDGWIPRPIKIGRRRLFDVRELDAAIAAKQAER